jgi:hypothetical protein
MLRCPEQTDQRQVFSGRRPEGGRLRMLSIGERHAWSQTDWQTNDVAIQVAKKPAENVNLICGSTKKMGKFLGVGCKVLRVGYMTNGFLIYD